MLDEEEGCTPDEPLFRRMHAEVAMADGRRLTAWVYTWNRPLERLSRIPSGDYVRYREGKV